ncbi:hypothetical protein D3C81_1958780 [compost metagenome]
MQAGVINIFMVHKLAGTGKHCFARYQGTDAVAGNGFELFRLGQLDSFLTNPFYDGFRQRVL